MNHLKYTHLIFFFYLLMCTLSLKAQHIATLTLNYQSTNNPYPLFVDLDGVTKHADSSLSLIEVEGSNKTIIPFQIEKNYHRYLWWISSIARWCLIDGDINNGHSGILFMSNPANYNFPKPMHVWPINMGDVFFSFSPTRDKSWVLLPNGDHVLQYRMLVFDGTITKDEAEQAWKIFAEPPIIKIEK